MTIRQSPDPTGCPEAGQNGPPDGLNRAPAGIDPPEALNAPQRRPLGPPTREQLLNLTDRAERKPLQPAEAARLRHGLEGLGEQLTVADGRIRRLAAQLGAARAEQGHRSVTLGLTPKPRATAADARELAARLESRPVDGGCRHCGGRCEPGRLSCEWCRRVLDGEQR